MQEKYLKMKDVLEIVPVSRNHWKKGVRDGVFPQGVKLTPRVTIWREADVLAVVAGEYQGGKAAKQ